jgi:hypothetical protein
MTSPIHRASIWADAADLVWQSVGRGHTAAVTRNFVRGVLDVRGDLGVPEAELCETRRIAELLLADIYADEPDRTGFADDVWGSQVLASRLETS